MVRAGSMERQKEGRKKREKKVNGESKRNWGKKKLRIMLFRPLIYLTILKINSSVL